MSSTVLLSKGAGQIYILAVMAEAAVVDDDVLLSLWPCFGCVRAGQGKMRQNYFPSLPSIESLCSKVLLKARTELFKVVLVHLAARLSSSPTNDR